MPMPGPKRPAGPTAKLGESMRPTGGGRRLPEAVAASVTTENAQHDLAVDVDRWAGLATRALAAEGIVGPAELALTFVDEATIIELNREHLGLVGPTDVLSFPIDDGENGGDEVQIHTGVDVAPRLLGDIVICPSVAAAQAPVHAGTLDDELALLVVHGVLHILGYDHALSGDAVVMRAREAELLSLLHGDVPVGTEIPPVPVDTGPA